MSLKLKQLRLKKVGGSYGFIVPMSVIKHLDVEPDKDYNIVIEIDHNGSMSFLSPELESSYQQFKRVTG